MNHLSEAEIEEAAKQAKLNATRIHGINPNSMDARTDYQNGFADGIKWLIEIQEINGND